MLESWLPKGSKCFSLHHTHYPSIRNVAIIILLMFMGMIAIALIPPIIELRGLKDYLPLHTALETISIIIAMLIFAVGWNTYSNKLPFNIVLISTVFFGVAVFDFTHVISYKGMPDFVTPSSVEKGIDFWLSARILSSVGLLLFIFLPLRPITSRIYKYLLLTAIFIVLGIVHWLVLYQHDLFPHLFFVQGHGLTPLKISIEYSIILLNLITASVLLFHMRKPLPYHASALLGALCIMAMGEFFFTLYAQVNDINNIFGHIYKAVAYLFIYQAIFVTTIQEPYKELEASQNQLDEKNKLLDNIIDNIPHLVFLKEASDLRFVIFNKAGETLLGKNREDILGRNDHDLFTKEQADMFAHADRETLQSNELLDIPEEFINTPNGTRILHTKKITLKDQNGDAQYLLGISEDITEKKEAEKALIESEYSLKESQKIAGLGSYTLDFRTGIWTSSDILDQLFGIGKDYERSFQGWETIVHPDDRISMNHYWKDEVIGQHIPFNQEYRIIRQNDKAKRWVHGLGKLEFDSQNNLIRMIGTIQDITEKKYAEERMEELAHYDQLTGLPNRVLLSDRIKYYLNHAQRNNERLAVMFLDLDHFKNINDTLGHTIGDMLLIEISVRLKESLRDEDTVSRSGGDEFIFIYPDTDANAAVHIATKMIEIVSIPTIIEHHELTITPSIGIAIYPNDGDTFETLLKNADTAMYQAKRISRNNFQFFTQEMQLNSSRNLQLTNALRHALERNELELHYQPQISTHNGSIIGAEALLRWTHPKFGMISPAEFIPIAEDSGQIIQIGEWVLRTAVNQMKAWKESGCTPMIIAVNLSAMQFQQSNLVELVTNILDEVQLPHEYLELELTEAITMNDPQSAIDIMTRLHDKGIRMSIDDFGTGYSSLSYLKQFKVYKLKIDQSFIRNIADDLEDQGIVKAIIQMANSLGLQTIAEGVETAEQLDFLRQNNCNEIQGYYYSKALPAKEFELFTKKIHHDCSPFV